MTSPPSPLLDTVDEMLLDAGQEQDAELRAALLSLGSLASLPAPAPNPELAALLGFPPDPPSWRRRLRRHRPAIVGLAVVAGMGLGATGVAASAYGPAGKASVSVQHLLEEWTPSWSMSGLPPATGLFSQPEPHSRPETEPAGAPAGQEAAADPARQNVRQGGPQQEPPGQEVPAQPSVPEKDRAGTAKAGPDDGGADARDASGAAGAATESAATASKVPSDPGTHPDIAQEAARQAVEKSEKLLSAVVPKSAVPKSAVPESDMSEGAVPGDGTKWLKKFSR